ncbi:hypothetical protein T4C_11085 [Trichinella pseudospiralis]|uniref:Uncharacterized protein n=1 Tax=Trichinella pseudospiralis TaxID=6337 RepID=A0A0V1ICY4_TRIPS|nr:hypothetical protein T4C_11085 [Trichinella pseudospiralis]
MDSAQSLKYNETIHARPNCFLLEKSRKNLEAYCKANVGVNLFHNYWIVFARTLQTAVTYQYKDTAIKKSPNFKNKVFAIFRKTT